MKRDFLHITDFTTEEVWETLELARWIKNKFYKIFVLKLLYKITSYKFNLIFILYLYKNFILMLGVA